MADDAQRLVSGVWDRLDPQRSGWAAGDGPSVEQVIPAVLAEVCELLDDQGSWCLLQGLIRDLDGSRG